MGTALLFAGAEVWVGLGVGDVVGVVVMEPPLAVEDAGVVGIVDAADLDEDAEDDEELDELDEEEALILKYVDVAHSVSSALMAAR
jgi:hypothetical protein